MMQFAASAAAIFTRVYSSSGRRDPPPFLRTPPGPPYTGGSTARPPRPRQEISLVEEVTRLEIPFSHWAKETPIKAEVPAYSGVPNPAPLSRRGWERLPVYRKKRD